MADRVSAHIMIGGVLSRSQYPVLVQAIGSDNAAVDWDGTPFDPAYLPVNNPLTLMDHEVAKWMLRENRRKLSTSWPSLCPMVGRICGKLPLSASFTGPWRTATVSDD